MKISFPPSSDARMPKRPSKSIMGDTLSITITRKEGNGRKYCDSVSIADEVTAISDGVFIDDDDGRRILDIDNGKIVPGPAFRQYKVEIRDFDKHGNFEVTKALHS